jgi:hypothetical protein
MVALGEMSFAPTENTMTDAQEYALYVKNQRQSILLLQRLAFCHH